MDLRFGEAKAMRGRPLESSLFISWVFSLALEVGYAAGGSLVHITTNLSLAGSLAMSISLQSI